MSDTPIEHKRQEPGPNANQFVEHFKEDVFTNYSLEDVSRTGIRTTSVLGGIPTTGYVDVVPQKFPNELDPELIIVRIVTATDVPNPIDGVLETHNFTLWKSGDIHYDRMMQGDKTPRLGEVTMQAQSMVKTHDALSATVFGGIDFKFVRNAPEDRGRSTTK